MPLCASSGEAAARLYRRRWLRPSNAGVWQLFFDLKQRSSRTYEYVQAGEPGFECGRLSDGWIAVELIATVCPQQDAHRREAVPGCAGHDQHRQRSGLCPLRRRLEGFGELVCSLRFRIAKLPVQQLPQEVRPAHSRRTLDQRPPVGVVRGSIRPLSLEYRHEFRLASAERNLAVVIAYLSCELADHQQA